MKIKVEITLAVDLIMLSTVIQKGAEGFFIKG